MRAHTRRQAESALLDAGVVTNRHSLPADANGAWYTSGVRLGTPALTTLGLGRAEMDQVADIVTATLTATSPAAATSDPSKAHYEVDDATAEQGRCRSAELLAQFPFLPADPPLGVLGHQNHGDQMRRQELLLLLQARIRSRR
jgi:glycine hydroxymethyltransferase